MRVDFLRAYGLLIGLTVLTLVEARAQVTFNWLEVGDVGNAADPLNSGSIPGIGSVSTAYKIAATEVTLDQYVSFLNAVAESDPNGLFYTSMSSDLNIAGINRSGSPGFYTYSVVGSGNRPVTYVSWNDAARFTNWLHNGQGSGGTESGVYDMSLSNPSRSGSASYWLPSENEWYKAAYYDPGAGGPADDYWRHATRSDTAPGNAIGPGANNANVVVFDFNDFQFKYAVTGDEYVSTQNYLTDVGAFSGAASYYGTFDQAGNVFEWTEGLSGSDRILRGGSWNLFESDQSDIRELRGQSFEGAAVGFRLAAVPEPSSGALLLLGAGMILWRRISRRA